MKPILFNTEMVRAILDGRKTVTRRVMKPQPLFYTGRKYVFADEVCPKKWEDCDNIISTYKYQPGDILYVRETWAPIYTGKGPDFVAGYMYMADEGRMTVEDYDCVHPDGKDWTWPGRWYPSIHMPKEAARIFLRVTDVRVERLQDSFSKPISPIFELLAEGMDIGDDCRECIEDYGNPCCVETIDEDGSNMYGGECGLLDDVRTEFSKLWDSTIKPKDREKYGWSANPFVWVISFERIEKPEEVTP